MSEAVRQRYQIATGKSKGQAETLSPSRSNGGTAKGYKQGGSVSKPSGFKKMSGKKC